VDHDSLQHHCQSRQYASQQMIRSPMTGAPWKVTTETFDWSRWPLRNLCSLAGRGDDSGAEGTSVTPCFHLPISGGAVIVAKIDGRWYLVEDSLFSIRPQCRLS